MLLSFGEPQFFVYFAWLCFGRAAVDPFGDDEDDINVKQLVQSHIEVLFFLLVPDSAKKN